MSIPHDIPNNFIPNSFQVPNIIVDEYMCKLSANAFRVYMVMVRKTKGWNKSSDSLSQGQIMSLTGISSHNTARKAINELVGFDLIYEDASKKGKQSTFYVSLHSEKLSSEQPSQNLTMSKIDNAPSQKLTTPSSENDDVPSQKLTTQNTEVLNTLSLSEKAPSPLSALKTIEKPESIDQDLWDEWLAIRLSKDSTVLTKRYLSSMEKEAALVGLTLAQAIEFCCDRSWLGFNATWYKSAQTAYIEKPSETNKTESLVATKTQKEKRSHASINSGEGKSVAPVGKTVQALDMLAKYEPKNWIERVVRDNLQAFLTAGFKNTPASEFWLKNILEWSAVLANRNFDEAADLKRIKKAFELMYSRIDVFPTVKTFFDYLPERELVAVERRLSVEASEAEKAYSDKLRLEALSMIGSKKSGINKNINY
ncbi:MAG: replication protein [Proteobacteria bacterium]|nr:replication protein [Pseudomonadota bacterium]